MGKILTMALKVGDEIRVSLVTGEKLRGPVQELTQTHAQVQGVRFALGDNVKSWSWERQWHTPRKKKRQA
jgi:hypothetical protein